jgi:hypothetical protein
MLPSQARANDRSAASVLSGLIRFSAVAQRLGSIVVTAGDGRQFTGWRHSLYVKSIAEERSEIPRAAAANSSMSRVSGKPREILM